MWCIPVLPQQLSPQLCAEVGKQYTSTDIPFPSLWWQRTSTCMCHVSDNLKRMMKEEEECGEGLNTKFSQHFTARSSHLCQNIG